MIEVVSISQNPVTAWEQFSLDLTPGQDQRNFSQVEIEHRAYGGFWSCSFRMHHEPLALLQMLENGLGREVVCKNDTGGIDFEGFINTMVLHQASGARVRISLDPVTNKVWVRYKDPAGTFARSAVASDTDSQARFGIKELTLSGGQLTATSIAQNLATMVLRRKRWPKKVPEDLSLGGKASEQSMLEVNCLGYIHTLEWRTYNQTASTGTQSADLQLADIVSGVGQFVAKTAFQPNPIGATRVYDADRDALSICFDIARLGDNQNPPQRWVLYMKEGRVLVYEPAAPEQLIDA